MNLLGNYNEIRVGYAKEDNIRLLGASGGVVTSILVNALNKKLIDEAIVIGMDEKEPWKPAVKIAKSKEGILAASGSKYVFISVKEILDKIKEAKGGIAVVGLPCHVKVIRNLQKMGKISNVKYVIGLLCGYNMAYNGTEYALKKLKINKEDIKELRYRGGKYPGGFYVSLKNGEIIKRPRYYYDFLNLMFVPKGCLNCKDYANEYADISVGDAWGYNNSSLIFIRTKKGKELLEIGNIKSERIPEKQVLKMHWHNIKHKKMEDGYFIKCSSWSLRRFKSILPFELLGFIAKLRRSMIKK